MFIQTESTPNPNSLKFILEKHELCESPIEFNKSQIKTNSVQIGIKHIIILISRGNAEKKLGI